MELFTLAMMGLPIAMQLALGTYQTIKGNKLSKSTRPTFQVPEGAISALNIYKNLASQTRLPGQSLMEEQLGNVQAESINQAKEISTNPTATLGMLGNLQRNRNQSLNQLSGQAAQYYAQNQGQLANQENTMADWQSKQWEVNKYQPYQADMQAGAAMKGAGYQNIFGGLSSATSTASTMMQNKEYLKQLQLIFGDNKAESNIPNNNANNNGAMFGFNPFMQQNRVNAFGQQIEPQMFRQQGGSNIPNNNALSWLTSILR